MVLVYIPKYLPHKLKEYKKQIYTIVKDQGFKITIETNLQKVNFLALTMDLPSESFQPFRKPNDNPLYINSKSNHPGHIIKNLPKAINRLSEMLCNENLFNTHKKRIAGCTAKLR